MIHRLPKYENEAEAVDAMEEALTRLYGAQSMLGSGRGYVDDLVQQSYMHQLWIREILTSFRGRCTHRPMGVWFVRLGEWELVGLHGNAIATCESPPRLLVEALNQLCDLCVFEDPLQQF